jgi:hypothetical protein
MTSPEPEPEVRRTEPEPERREREAPRRRDWRDLAENPIAGWAKAIALGIGDTAKDMLDAGREGAREAMDEGWERFDRKTKHRRG